MGLSKSGTRFAAPIRRLVWRRMGVMSVMAVRDFCDEKRAAVAGGRVPSIRCDYLAEEVNDSKAREGGQS